MKKTEQQKITELVQSLDSVLNTDITVLEQPAKFIKSVQKLEKDIDSRLSKLIASFNKQYTYCANCKKYYKTKTEKSDVDEYTMNVCVYRDCGYGDDDEYADVTYRAIYRVCPLCKKRNGESYRYPIKESNRRGRWS